MNSEFDLLAGVPTVGAFGSHQIRSVATDLVGDEVVKAPR